MCATFKLFKNFQFHRTSILLAYIWYVSLSRDFFIILYFDFIILHHYLLTYIGTNPRSKLDSNLKSSV